MSITFFNAIYGLLTGLGSTVALGCFIMAAIAMHAEGGGLSAIMSRSVGRWLLWGAIFLGLPGLTAFMNAEGFTVGSSLTSGSAVYTTPLQTGVQGFVDNYLLDRFIPIIAASLLFKAIFDLAEGKSFFPSFISAIFVLSIQGTFSLASGWSSSSDEYSVTTVLWDSLGYMASNISPVAGALCIAGAVYQYVRGGQWISLVFAGICFLSVSGLWVLLVSLAGVTVS